MSALPRDLAHRHRADSHQVTFPPGDFRPAISSPGLQGAGWECHDPTCPLSSKGVMEDSWYPIFCSSHLYRVREGSGGRWISHMSNLPVNDKVIRILEEAALTLRPIRRPLLLR